MILALAAAAGTLTVDDRAGILDALDVQRLREESAGLNFDVHVYTGTRDLADLQVAARAARSGKRQVILAVDPEHRQTWVEVGPGVKLTPDEYRLVANAGQAAFRQKRWGDGVMAMLMRAATPDPRFVETTTVKQAPVEAEAPGPPWVSWIGAGIAALGAVFALRGPK